MKTPHRFSGAILFEGEYGTIKECLLADLRGADLSGADLRGADSSWADLSGANLSWADLSGANLRGANLRGADLSWADSSGADLSGANLSGADLSWAKGIAVFGPIPTSGRLIYAVSGDTVMVQAGCFWGNLADVQAKIEADHKDSTYLAVAELLKTWRFNA